MSPSFEKSVQKEETVLLGESDEIYEIHLFFKRRSKRRRREESGKQAVRFEEETESGQRRETWKVGKWRK